MNKLKVISDLLLNIIASAMPVIILQLAVFPFIASKISEGSYGLMITVYSLLNIIPSAIGTTLNNIRLLHQTNYNKFNYIGDFSLLVFGGGIINIIIIIFSLTFFKIDLSMLGILTLLIISLESLVHDYLIVEYRIKLNFKMILYDRIILAIGYLIGLILFNFTDIWLLPFLVGHSFNIIYTLLQTEIWKEKFIKTPLFEIISKETVYFFISTILLRLTTYADKLLLFPLLGGEAVSVYYAATILSKIIALAITPMNSVVLSYLSKISKKPNNLFWKIFLISCCICLIGYFLSVFVSESLLTIFYPMFKSLALNYIYITSATTVLNILASIIQPFVLKYSSMKFQIVINSSDVFLYVTLSLILLSKFGLMGFCIGILISRVFKVILLLAVYIKSDNNLIENAIADNQAN